jgi:hypothetical protein
MHIRFTEFHLAIWVQPADPTLNLDYRRSLTRERGFWFSSLLFQANLPLYSFVFAGYSWPTRFMCTNGFLPVKN